MQVKQLGTIVFDHNYIHINEDSAPATVMSETSMSMAGTHIVFEAEIFTPYITLDSQQDSWITDIQKAQLETMWGQLGSTWTLTYDDDSTETVRMAREKQISFTPLFEGGCEYFRVVIPLAKMLP